MSGERNAIGKQSDDDRRKRVEQMKKTIIIFVAIFTLLPSVCCMALFMKITGMEKRLDSIDLKQQEITVEEYGQENLVVHAAPKETKNVDSSPKDNEVKETTAPKKETMVDQTKIKGKKVYLTFDDGPSKNTQKILDILDEYKVKATFFVIGKTDDFSKQMYKEIYENGHTLAMHSYTHQYKTIYKTLGAYKKDIKQLSDLLFEVTGERPKYVRFPGGSSNTVSKISMKDVIRYVDAEGLTYFDWNVVNGDATGKKLTDKQMVNNVISGVESYENSIVLMHDCAGKEMTVETLPTVLKKLKNLKANILPINDTTIPVQHVHVEDTVKNN
ncbi:MAG: polysaccharide deacetylase [Clostridiales bacterium]|nr:polysaccharide deacetylase [Clostridiales bacterium]